MSSDALSSHDSVSRSWWSLSRAPNPSNLKDVPQVNPEKPRVRNKSGLNFNTLVSAIGLKSKKRHPSLATQDPPLPLQSLNYPPPNLSQPQNYANRPPSKSISSTRSRADSAGPRTPSDVHQAVGRQSLLTLSDIDPFAVRSILTASSPQLPSDLSRLSAYSNSSMSDFPQKKNGELPVFERRSYASSSSQSHCNSSGEPSQLKQNLSPLSSTGSRSSLKLSPKRSTPSLKRKQLSMIADVAATPTAHSTIPKSGSSTTLTGLRSSHPEPVHIPRPTLRPRGLTDGGSTQRAGFFTETSLSKRTASVATSTPPSRKLSTSSQNISISSQSPSPRVVIRQASLQRIAIPPRAPPSQGLPATPQSPVHDVPDEFDPSFQSQPDSTSSSTLSFASSVSSLNDIFVTQSTNIRGKTGRGPDRKFHNQTDKGIFAFSVPEKPVHLPPQSLPASPFTIKKALSHQSLLKRSQKFSSTSGHPPLDQETGKAPVKQHSLPQSGIPIPPIPLTLRHANSYNSAIGNPSGSFSDKRASTSSHHGGRKRLFSGSSLKRPSTSGSPALEDDNRSVFSFRSEQDSIISTSFFKPWVSPQPQPSFWDEGIPDTMPNSPIRGAGDYAPQQIMSQAEMAKLETSLDRLSCSLRRQQGVSLRSAVTMVSEGDSDIPMTGLSPPPRAGNRSSQRSSGLSPRNMSDADNSVSLPSTKLPQRPSTAQTVVQLPDPSDHSIAIYRPSSSPPPSMASLPPPPRPRQRAAPITQPEQPSIASLPLPPVRRPSRSKVSVEKAMHRRSIMRKPSFLEIDDDTDKESDGETADNPVSVSFLDLARESFDTVRSDR